LNFSSQKPGSLLLHKLQKPPFNLSIFLHKMIFSKTTKLALLLALPFAFSACKKDKKEDPKPNNADNEVITTIRYTLTPVGGGTTITAQSRDVDGDGGAAPVLTYTGATGATKLVFDKAKTYTGDILILDETKSPVDTVSNEVFKEADEHLFVYKPLAADLLTIVRTDFDASTPVPLPLGLKTTVTPRSTAGTGTLQIILRHQPGVKNGLEAPGDTDVDVTFPVEVR
jgi:hypothetical protein